ncbi:hypothetical protein GCM10009863_39150 [Streptomyces axinellae]|uniref:Uncharacterized protein n=1 Tax=Streptomyces axinellae TaxID=552788 RepID=A0ABP6CMT3_9ACTN
MPGAGRAVKNRARRPRRLGGGGPRTRMAGGGSGVRTGEGLGHRPRPEAGGQVTGRLHRAAPEAVRGRPAR